MPDIILSKSINGPFMLIHEVTGTYLEMDNYHDGVGQGIQTWNLDPTLTSKGYLGHLWYLEPVSEDTCLIKSYENSRCLTAGVNAKAVPVLQNPDGSDKQKWVIRRVHGSDGLTDDADSYAILPKSYPGYALSVQNNLVANNVYVSPTSTWGGPPSISQYWKAVLQREVAQAGAGTA
ncbi:hypothetical protein GCM10027290_04910 [Micromonospora sonneratiae]|uniref:RICIN domain-containing protein n=1 Tax=Micromonospora sonneratiae TaxID=1184706 RepID=A0ABW3YJR0_9ACTN